MRMIFEHGVVFTGALPLQQAFGVEDGVFFFVGSDADAQGMDAQIRVDLKGQFVCPGFHDSHMHLLNFGQTLSMGQLHKHTKSLEDMIDCLRGVAPGRGGWIMGRGWNQDYFEDVHRLPNRYDLDRVSLEHPVCAVRACGHGLVVNSKALELLGITAHTPVPEGGQIPLEDGTPNGQFFDNAMDLVYSQIAVPELETVKNLLRRASAEVNRYGITSCQSDDYCVFQNLPWQMVNQAYRELEAAGELTVRVYEQANFTQLEALKGFIRQGNLTGTGTEFFRIGPLKMLGDGALGARTAFLSGSYADAPGERGLSVFAPEEFDSLIGYAHENGMQVAVHCIGDGCLDRVLHSMEKAQKAHPRQDHRHGIVHCQITRPDQLQKLMDGKYQIYAQSIFLDYDIHIVNQRVGTELASSSYSWKTLKNGGCNVSNGSDCPVELPHVMGGIQCAVTRRDLKGFGPYLPEEAFTLEEALQSFTVSGAWASFEENRKGQIRSGMLADFVVLGADPFKTEESGLKDIPVLQTWLGGKQVYAANVSDTIR